MHSSRNIHSEPTCRHTTIGDDVKIISSVSPNDFIVVVKNPSRACNTTLQFLQWSRYHPLNFKRTIPRTEQNHVRVSLRRKNGLQISYRKKATTGSMLFLRRDFNSLGRRLGDGNDYCWWHDAGTVTEGLAISLIAMHFSISIGKKDIKRSYTFTEDKFTGDWVGVTKRENTSDLTINSSLIEFLL